MDMAVFLQETYQYQGITITGSDLLECYAERAVPDFLGAASFTHGVKMRRFDGDLKFDTPEGEEVTIKASSVKAITKGFLKWKRLESLRLTDDLASLAEEFREYLRTIHRQKCLKEKRESNYYLIRETDGLNWLYNICFLALVEYIGIQKDKEDTYVDKRVGILVAFKLGMRGMRGNIFEGDNHNKKNKYMEGRENEEDVSAGEWFKKYEELVEELSKRGLPDFQLPPLPEGIACPLQLPMGTKKKAS